MKTKLIIIALVSAALGIGLAVRAHLRVRQSRAALQEFDTRREAVREKTAQWDQRLRAAQSAAAGVRSQSGTGVAMPPASTAAGAPAIADSNEAVDWAAFAGRKLSAKTAVANDPEKMAAHGRELRRSLDLEYGGMFRALGLSPGQIEKFKDLRIEGEQLGMDRRAAAEMQGIDRKSEAYLALARANDEMLAKKEAEILGPLAEPYREFQRTQFFRNEVRRLASIEIYPETPATWAQVERATTILDQHSQRGPDQSWMSKALSIDWSAATPPLAGVLSAGQLARLQGFFAYEATMAKVMKETDRLTAQFKSEPPPK